MNAQGGALYLQEVGVLPDNTASLVRTDHSLIFVVSNSSGQCTASHACDTVLRVAEHLTCSQMTPPIDHKNTSYMQPDAANPMQPDQQRYAFRHVVCRCLVKCTFAPRCCTNLTSTA